MSAFGPLHVSMRQQHMSAYVSIRQHTSAYCSIRQHTVADVSRRVAYAHCIHTYIHTYIYIYIHVQIAAQGTHLLLSPPPSTSAYVSIRQHTSAYLSIEAYVSIELTYRSVQLLARSVLILLFVPSYYYICVLILLYVRPHSAEHVSLTAVSTS
jgi:hypothetical protein